MLFELSVTLVLCTSLISFGFNSRLDLEAFLAPLAEELLFF
jgi:hypothetical protein